jgi:chromosomal replication initiator protein
MSQDPLIKHFFNLGTKTPAQEQLNNQFSVNSTPISAEATAHAENEDELNVINNEVLNHLKTIVPELKFKTYFENSLELKSINGGNAVFNVKTAFIKKSAELYKDEMVKSLYNVLGTEYNILINAKDQSELSHALDMKLSSFTHFSQQEDQKPKSLSATKFTLDLTPTRDDLKSKADAEYIEHMNPNKSGIRVDRSKTFDNFIVGPTNNIAQAAAKAVALTPGKEGKYPSLYIHSNSGLGKTHLLHAVANEIAEKHPTYTICLITARDFMDEMITLMKTNRINEFVRKYTEKIDVLMMIFTS